MSPSEVWISLEGSGIKIGLTEGPFHILPKFLECRGWIIGIWSSLTLHCVSLGDFGLYQSDLFITRKTNYFLDNIFVNKMWHWVSSVQINAICYSWDNAVIFPSNSYQEIKGSFYWRLQRGEELWGLEVWFVDRVWDGLEVITAKHSHVVCL